MSKISNFDVLVDWLGSIENFIGRLSVYTDNTLPPAMIEIVVKIMGEIITTLGLVTKKFRVRKRGEFSLVHVFLYSVRHRQT